MIQVMSQSEGTILKLDFMNVQKMDCRNSIKTCEGVQHRNQYVHI